EIEPRPLVGHVRRRRRNPKGAGRLPDPALTTPGFCRVTRKNVGLPSPLVAPSMVQPPDFRRRFPVGEGGLGHRPEVVGELATALTFPTWSAPLGQTFGRGGGRVRSPFQVGEVVERKRRRTGASKGRPEPTGTPRYR